MLRGVLAIVFVTVVAGSSSLFRDALGSHVQHLHTHLTQKATNGYRPTAPSPIPMPNGTYSETGFFYLTNSYNADCSASYLSYGIPVDKCIIDEGFAYKFQLVEDSCVGGIVQYFKDMECTIQAGSSDLEPSSGNCSLATNANIAGRSDVPVYANLLCTTSDKPRVAAQSAVMEYYVNTTTCDDSENYVYVAYTAGECISFNETHFVPDCSSGSVVFDMAPEGAATCSEDFLPYALPDSCELEVATDDGDDDDGSIYNPSFIQPPPSVSTTPFPTAPGAVGNNSNLYYCQDPNTPSAEPTAAPSEGASKRPTAQPSPYPSQLVAAPAGFGAVQDIYGITFAEFNTNPTLNTNTLLETIAASMIAINPGNIINFLVAASTSTPQTAIKLTYAIEAVSIYTSVELSLQLSESVDSGAFNTLLQTNAETNGAAYLDQATCPALSVYVYNPSMAPTARPSTAYPTSATAARVAFYGKQVINGISLDTYNSDVPTYKKTLQQSVASSMMGVPDTDVTDLQAAAAASSSANVRASAVTVVMRHLRLEALASSDAVQVTYTVDTTTSLSQASLEAQLTESVSTGHFDTLLHSYATTNGATGLMNATSDSITITADTASSHSSKLTTAELIGVIIGSVAAVVILVGLIYCLAVPKKAPLNQQTGVEL